jgi:hypothetical protein
MYSLRFPSRFQRFIRAPAGWLSEALSQILEETCKGANEERIFKADIGKWTGVTLMLRLMPEGDVSFLELTFVYRGLILAILASLIIFIGLGILSSSIIPLIGLTVIPIMTYRAGFEISSFLSDFNNILLGLEAEYSRIKIMEDRVRWQLNPKDIGDLYRRLCNKYIKVWGSTYALEYKISEYQRQGLTRDEAIRKVSEEEGIF